jgi:hypothetical protein
MNNWFVSICHHKSGFPFSGSKNRRAKPQPSAVHMAFLYLHVLHFQLLISIFTSLPQLLHSDIFACISVI